LEDRVILATASATEKDQRDGRRQDGQTCNKVHVLPRSKPMGSLRANPAMVT